MRVDDYGRSDRVFSGEAFSFPRLLAPRALARPPAPGYNCGMKETTLPLPLELWATMPAPEPVSLLEELAVLRQENATLRARNTALQERIRELDAQLGQNSANS